MCIRDRQGLILTAAHVVGGDEIMGDASLGDFWDHGLMVNDALWDSWFCLLYTSRCV